MYHALESCHAQNMSHLDYFYRLFPIRITAGFVIPVRKSVGLLRNVKLSIPLGINTGMLCCIVKLPDEVCVSHTIRVGDKKKFYNSSSSQKSCSLV